MIESAPALSVWESFYVIVGSAGGALIGLQFVVIALIADRRHIANAGSLSAFGTPTVVHFAAALVVSAIMSAPWPSLAPLSAALACCGAGGLAYSAVVVGRARRQRDYTPVGADWIWYAVLPCLGYAALTAAAAVLPARPPLALPGVAISALGLLLVGIHNAWDTVTHIVVTNANGGTKRRH